MLIHPYNGRDKSRLTTFTGTRLLKDGLGIVGATLEDPSDATRVWRVQSIYAPIQRRGVSGVRTKLVDQYEFITFCNQRDLEVLLGIGTPGRYCPWMGGEYVELGDPEWYGLCADEEDLLDDLYDRESLLRQTITTPLIPSGASIKRRVYYGGTAGASSTRKNSPNFAEEWDLLWDMNPDTGECPDPRLETLTRRWSRTVKERVQWAEAY